MCLGFVAQPIHNFGGDEAGAFPRRQNRHTVALARGALSRRGRATGELGKYAPSL
jgi:hypothetical protein